ncbi:MAG TPA: bifunctional UDP-sugar hydrolase/5'-nucleotidase [Methanocorpusculum sp.]|nr:bifunctional UDP-sugar hydrolase/5'-nucleotidase [Methanocorpusculum sp.]
MKYKKITAVLLAAVLVLLLCAGPVAAADLVIVHTNDVHARFADNIGYDGLSAYIQDLRKAGNDVLVFDCGDAFQGLNDANFFEGESSVELMNMVGYDAMTLGTHDFDFGYDRTLQLKDKANFPLLACNIFYEKTGEPVFSDSVILTAGGKKVGVFGLATPEIQLYSHPKHTEGLKFLTGDEIYAKAQEEVDSLKSQGCDLIICLSSLGIDDTSKGIRSVDLAEKVTGIDLIIDGHSHTELANGMAVGNTLIVNSGCYLYNIGVVKLQNGKLAASLVSDYTKKDETVSKKINEYLNEVNIAYGEIVGKSEVLLNGQENPGSRTEETNLGDLICDALFWKAKKLQYSPDIALINGGSIRASIQPGDITMHDVVNVLPFSNTLTIMEIKGSALLQALEMNTANTPGAEGGFPHVSGMVYYIDTSKPYVEGEINRVTIASVGDYAFNPDRTYKVVTNDYISAGGDKYSPFAGAKATNLGRLLDMCVIEYVSEALDHTVSTSYEKPAGRIIIGSGAVAPVNTNVASSPAPAAGLLAGLAAALFAVRKIRK